MDLENPDLVDILEQLKFQNPIIQSQGLSQLVEKLKSTNVSNGKKENKILNVFFDCSFLYGECVQNWFTELFPSIIETGRITDTEVYNEILQRIHKIAKPDILFYRLIEVCKPSIASFLKLTKRLNDDSKVRIFTNKDFTKKNIKYLRALIFSNSISENVGNVIFSNLDIQDLLMKSKKSKTDVFQKLIKLRENQEIIFDEKFESHNIFLPELIAIMQSRQLLWKQVDESKMMDESKKLRTLISSCQVPTSPPKIEISTDSEISIQDLFHQIVAEGNTDVFINFVDFYFNKMHQNPILLPFLTGLFPFSKNTAKLCDLIVKMVTKNPHEANTYALYFISLFGKPFFKIERHQIIKTLTCLAINRFVVSPIVKFLCAMSQQPINEKCAIFESLGELVQKYPTIYSSILPVAKNILPNEETNIFIAKLGLIRNCCLATDDCDELLSFLSKLLKEDGVRLNHTIDIVYDLVKNDVLDFKTVRRQLSKKVAAPGTNSNVLIAYCRILSLGFVPDKDETEEENIECRHECIKELYSYTRNLNENIASEAWKSLSEYAKDEISEAVNIDISTIISRFGEMRNVERQGFAHFAHKIISKEIDGYPRPLYNISGPQTSDVAPLYTRIDTYKDSMLMKTQNEEWFWNATLPLVAPILQLTSASNKALVAVRLIRSCATMIPPPTSHEEMIRLMASWRICIREALNSLSESRNNDIIWARDQICEEGRRALAEKCESVDNVMMILTVLVGIMDEKLKMLEDVKQIGEVVISQKPWLISVFEFCATRLPKDVKSKRETKAAPIYQILTQSNKSSLHIAIFCIRLLYRSSMVIEFYGDISGLGLIEDNLYTCLVEDLTRNLNDDEIPDRKLLWIIAEAYGIDIMTIRAFEKKNKERIESKSRNEEIIENIDDAKSIRLFFEQLCSSNGDVQLEYQVKSKKMLEKLWNNGTDEVKRAIYVGLSQLNLCSANGKMKTRKLVAIEKLPESSVLRNILSLYDEKNRLDRNGRQLLIPCFVGHRRNDGRFLPSIDWKHILEKSDWKTISKEMRVSAIELACEQNIEDVIFDVINSNTNLSEEEVTVFAKHLPNVVKILPRRISINIIKNIIMTARNTDGELCKAISENQSNSIVRQVLIHELPNLEIIQDLSDVILSCLKDPQEFVGNISSQFDFWIEARNRNGMKMKRLCELFSAEDNIRNRNVMIAILSIESGNLTMEKRIEKILDVITISRISRSSNQNMFPFLPIILALIVSQCEKINQPLFWFGAEDRVIELICSLRKPFIEQLVSFPGIEENIQHIVSFLRPYVCGEECGVYEKWQRDIANDMMLLILTKKSSSVMEFLENESDEFWNTVLQC